MARVFHCSSAESSLTEHAWGDLEHLTQQPGWVWIDLADPTKDESLYVADRFGPQPTMSDLDPFRADVEIDDDQFAASIHGAVPGAVHQLVTSEVRLIVSESMVLTIHAHDVVDSDAAIRRIQALDPDEQTPGGVAAVVALDGVVGYRATLRDVDDQVEDVEDLAIGGDPTTLGMSQVLRRDVVLLRKIISAQRDTIRRLSDPTTPNLDVTARREFNEIDGELARMIEALDVARGLLSSALETYRGAVAERTNETMKVLTVFSAILLPLGLLAGIWGMNFPALPFVDQEHGFMAMIITMTTLAAVVWFYFRRRGFIGGPRLRDIPRFVGLTLVSLGTAPRRAATSLLNRSDASDDS